MLNKLKNLLNMHEAGDMNVTYHNGKYFFFSDKYWYMDASSEAEALASIKKHKGI